MAYKKIIDDSGNFPDRWDWSAKPTFEGYYEETKKAGDLTFHELTHIVDGKNYSILGGTVLDKRLATCNKGDRIRITFKGMAKTKEGRQFKNYEIEKWTEEEDSPNTAF